MGTRNRNAEAQRGGAGQRVKFRISAWWQRGSQPRRSGAEERAIKLPNRKRDGGSPGEEGGESSSAATSRRTPEERRKHRSAKERLALAAKAVPRPKQSVRSTRGTGGPARKLERGERKPPGTLERAFTQVLAILGALLVGVARLVHAAIKALGPPTASLRRRLAAWIATLSRIVTPVRGLLLAAIGCALLLALSQFVDYRGISIGADAYDPGVSAVAPAPEVERAELGTAHGYAMVPVAALAVLALAFAVRTGRWQLCRLAVLLGIVAIVVAIVIDRPAGLDEGDLEQSFTGVEAKLLGGFWMQIFAGAGLAVTSFLLSGEIKRSGARHKRGARRRAASKPGKRSTAPKAEGAGA